MRDFTFVWRDECERGEQNAQTKTAAHGNHTESGNHAYKKQLAQAGAKTCHAGTSLLLGFSKGKKALADIVEAGEQYHAGKHRAVVAQGNRCARQHPIDRWLGDAIGEQIAHRDVQCEAHSGGTDVVFVAKRKGFVENITQNTRQNIVCGRGHPVAASGEIV